MQIQCQDLESGKAEKASGSSIDTEPLRQSPSTVRGTASKVFVKLVTRLHAARRDSLESEQNEK